MKKIVGLGVVFLVVLVFGIFQFLEKPKFQAKVVRHSELQASARGMSDAGYLADVTAEAQRKNSMNKSSGKGFYSSEYLKSVSPPNGFAGAIRPQRP